MSASDDLAVIGFIDESCKPVRDRGTGKVLADRRHYVAAAAITLAGDGDRLRSQIRSLEASVGAPLHYGDLTSARRLAAARAIADIDGWEGHLFETAIPFLHGTSEHHVRAKLIEAALIQLSDVHGVTAIVFEARGHARDGFERLNQKDHDVLRRLQRQRRVDPVLRISHDTKEERCLVVADLLAGARTDELCAVSSEPYALVAHRVRSIHRVELA